MEDASQTKGLSGSSALPKVSMPWMPKAYPRLQIFTRLADSADARLVWVSAPAGYGKTTAISSYLRNCGRPTAWYQCDEGDNDLASFFYYAAVAGRHLHGERHLPNFLPEYRAALPTFCRNFFRLWFADLPAGSTLVLDNWQDVASDAALRGLLPIVTDEIPAGVQLIVISRDEPDANLSRLVASERMELLGTRDLQLTRHETQGIAIQHLSRQRQAPPLDIDEIYRTTLGWAAGVTLSLRPGARLPSPSQTEKLGSTQAIFDYLATQVFERLNATVQEFLLRVAYVEHIALPVAQALCGSDDAASILATLVQQNVFTAYRAVSDSYHFHPLFRTFLLLRGSKTHCPDDRRRLLVAAGRASGTAGQHEAGIHLLLEAKAWGEAAAAICRNAATFLDQGRVETLASLVDALPETVVASDAWLMYWQGLCRITLDFPAARSSLEQAYDRFCVTQQLLGQSLACAAILRHIAYSYMDYRPMLPWIDRLERTLELLPRFADARTELEVRAAFMLALSQAIPKHPKLADSVERVSRLVRSEVNSVTVAEGVSALLHFFSRFGRTAHYGDLDTIVERLLHGRELAPIHRLNLLWLHAYQLHSSGDPERVMQILGSARALARHEGLHGDDARMRLCELQAQEIGDSATTALATFSELEPMIRGMPVIPRAHFLYVRSLFELGCGHCQAALKYAEEALPLIRTSHWHIGEALALTGLAEVYCAAGRHADAARCVEECFLITEGVQAPLIEFNAQLARAEIARHRGDRDEMRDSLVRAFAIGREQGYGNGFHTSSQLLKRLIAYGIEWDIEPSYCRWVIARRHFTPPSASAARWPWRIKIRALGRLQIFIDDAELRFSGKAQRKPLDLLKLLIASPRGVVMSQIADDLWPDLDGDAARNALDIALHRLRKLLKFKDAVLVRNGSIALNEIVVWLDVIAFERITSGQSHAVVDLPRELDDLLDLYRGSLLSAEEAPRAVEMSRKRLRVQFAHAVSSMATRLKKSDLEVEIPRLFLGAIEREPGEEFLHRQFRRFTRDGDVAPAADQAMTPSGVLAAAP